MGKDNLTFHTVIFPSTLIATGSPWTMLNSISSTEYLNYEDIKFSKSQGTGVFGDDAASTGIPSEVWRYYLLINRPEQSDSTFTWPDLQAKNNGELLNNLGNFSYRALSFLKAKYDGKVPAYEGDQHEQDRPFIQSLIDSINKYTTLMDAVKLKDGLKEAMNYSMLCNGYW